MNPEARSILICDDNPDHLMLLKRELERFSPAFQVATVTSAEACRREMARAAFDVVLIDYLLRDVNGLDLLREVTASYPDTIAIMITGMGNEDVAVQAMKCGAGDYLIKSSGGFAVVPLVVTRALERKALLEVRRTVEKEADREAQLGVLGSLALGVAHDLNELLAAILGRAQLLRERSADPAAAEQLGVVETAARDAAAIVRRILEFAGGAEPEPAQEIRLEAAVRDCLEFTRSRWEAEAHRRGVIYRLNVEVPGDLIVQAPASAVREVITNLILNALEAMPEGGRLILRAMAGPREAHLFVQDSGCGMTGETLKRLAAAGTVSAKPGGHGVGLATSRALLERLGGRLQIESELGTGTTCEVILPLRAVSTDDCPPAARPASPTGLRVLVVDNEPRIAALMEDILVMDGQRVQVAYSGEEAMSKFEPGACDVVFCDLSLPGMSGLEVARAVRALDATAAVVLVSGWGSEAIGKACDRDCVDIIAAKPMDLEKIRALAIEAAALVLSRRDRGRAG